MNCKNCEHCLFDPQWGEYKCEERKTILYIMLHQSECSDFKEKKTDELRLAKPNIPTEGSY